MEVERFCERMTALYEDNFRYGGYDSKPSTPFANYARLKSRHSYTDDRVSLKIYRYVVRLVAENHDVYSEGEKIETIFDDLGMTYILVTEEWVESEKVMVLEWEVDMIG